jgi:hypothetical protein
VGAGGLLGMIILTKVFYSYDFADISIPGIYQGAISMDVILMITIVLAGVIGTARLVLKMHEREDIYGGYMVGLSTQLMAYQILQYYGT